MHRDTEITIEANYIAFSFQYYTSENCVAMKPRRNTFDLPTSTVAPVVDKQLHNGAIERSRNESLHV